MNSSKMMMAILVAVILLELVDSSPQSFYPRITKGENTFKGEFPFMASMQLGLPPDYLFVHVCAGVIYSSYWIISAATCIYNITGVYTARVKVGIHYMVHDDKDVQLYGIAEKFAHEYYDKELMYNNIGVIKTDTEMSITAYVYAARIHRQPDLPIREFQIVGWGATNSKGKKPSTLQKAFVKLLRHDDCVQNIPFYPPLAKLLNSQICTNTPFKPVSVCSGDNGGALIYYSRNLPVVAGIISDILPSCGTPGMPIISTLISPFLGWIKSKIEMFP